VLGSGDIGALTTTVTPTGSWTTNKRRLFVARKNGNGEVAHEKEATGDGMRVTGKRVQAGVRSGAAYTGLRAKRVQTS
jgi:hypothetical protein